MGVSMIVTLMRGGVIQIFKLIMPALAVALTVGLIVAIFQAVTSIQEQTLTFLPKFISILVVIALLSGWMFTELGEYTRMLFNMIPELAR
ncbi:MAG: flagellar biosynthesis protein FliQ [Treponema sp.]|nr:flagellar biosynthesis protein FliQ [Treponema sp.]MBQ5999881.1 flagellar biosynthesis protein FliQ [Treponema sp.]